MSAELVLTNTKPAEANVHRRSFSLLGRCIESCSARSASLVFTDGEDARAVRAALRLGKEGLANVLLLGRVHAVRAVLRAEISKGGLPLQAERLRVLDPENPELLERNTSEYIDLVRAKGKDINFDEARKFMSGSPACGAMLVRRGEVEAGVGGNVSSTAAMLRAGLRVLGVAPGGKTISSFFFMLPPVNSQDHRQVIIFSDCGVIPEPSIEQLADIAIDSAKQFSRMTGEEAKVAMLSFSSHGSSQHPRAGFVREVVELVRKREPNLLVDGELQFDAAMLPKVALQKVPDSPLKGEANVLVFPSLEAGNIGYKIAQRLGGYTAIGPMLQGLAGGWHDLSRGCSEEDIYQVALVGAALQRGNR